MSLVGKTTCLNSRFTPQDLPGLTMWLDAADATTLTLSGNTVTQWRDKSGQGYTLTVPSGGYTSPTYSNGILNMSGSNALWSTSNFEISGNTPLTLFLVGSVTRIGGNGPGAHIGLAGSATPPQYFGVVTFQDSTKTILYTPSCFGPDVDRTLTPNISGQRTILCAFYDGTVIQGTYNGTLGTSKSLTTANFASRPFQIGNRNAGSAPPNEGTICESICYAGALTTTQRQVVEGYLARKWGITALTGDPYQFGGPRILPTQISGCSLWLDGADPAGTGIPPSIGTSVSTWVDKSGNGRNGISGGTSIPTFSNRGITYDGSGSYTTSYSAVLPAETLFVVFRWSNIVGGPGLITGTQWLQRIVYVEPAASRWLYFGGIASWGRWNTTPLSSNVDYMFGVTWNSSSVTMHLNGSPLATAGSAGNIGSFSGSPTNSVVGATFNGTMYEMIGYNTVLTTAQRQLVEGYLANKWGLQASFPAPITIGPYAGPIIPTRTFSPLDVDGLSLWLDAADARTLTLSGSNVTQWRDKSGNGLHVAQTTTARQPTYTATGFNGLPAVRFSTVVGSSVQILTSATTSLFDTLANATIFLVFRVINVGTNPPYHSIISIPNKLHTYLNGLNNSGGFVGTNAWTWSGGRFIANSNTTVPQDVNQQMVYSLASGLQQIYINGILGGAQTSSFSVTTGTSLTLSIGSITTTSYNDGFNGNLSEVLFFSNALTTTQRQQVETYLADKWGLRASMSVVSHPYRFGPAVVRPTDISGCVLWLDAADGATFNGGATWTDKSGTGNHGINGTPGSSTMPTVTTWPNGLTAARFVKASKNSVKTTNVIPNLNVTYFFVVRITGADGAKQVLMINNVDGRRQVYTQPSSFPAQVVALAAWPVTPTNVISVAQSVPFLYSATLSGGFNIYANGTDLGSSSLGTSAASQHYFGSGNGDDGYLSGDYGEILIYSTVLTTLQRQQIEGYLAWKWGLQTNLPGSTASSFARLKRVLTPAFTPTQIPGCALWLDAADTTTLTRSGINVTQWRDKSGSSNHYANNGTVTYQSDGVYFNGSAFMQNTTLTGFQYGGTSLSTFIIVSVASVPATGGIFSYGTIGCGRTGYVLYADTDSRVYGTLYCGDLNVNTLITLNTRNVISDVITFSGGASRAAWINGAPFVTATATGAMTLTSSGFARIGASGGGAQLFVGTINEVLFYNRAVSASERQRIEGYLAHKWGLLGTLGGVSHPSRFGPVTIVPTQIAGCALWLDATDSTSMTLSGANVAEWRDKSSNAYVGTAVSSPTLQANSINGLSAVQFNGSSQYITFGNVLNVGTSHIHVFVITRFTGDAAVIGKSSYRANLGRWAIYRGASDGGLGFSVDASPGAFAPFADTTTTTQLLRGSWDRSTLSITQNGTQRASATLANTTTNLTNTDNLLVAAYGNSTGTGVQPGFFLNGVIGEILVYIGTLTVSQRQQIEGYLAWKWGLQENLPSSTHPYRTFKP
jgi:hypothetical protein